MMSNAGSGKSTLSKNIVDTLPNFARLSIDQLLYAAHGLYGVDYHTSLYEDYQIEAGDKYVAELRRLLSNKPPTNLVLDRSFYARSDRDDYRRLIAELSGRCVLVYFDATKEVLWRRIRERTARGRDADSAFDVTEEILDGYLTGFERPNGEGEVVIYVT